MINILYQHNLQEKLLFEYFYSYYFFLLFVLMILSLRDQIVVHGYLLLMLQDRLIVLYLVHLLSYYIKYLLYVYILLLFFLLRVTIRMRSMTTTSLAFLGLYDSFCRCLKLLIMEVGVIKVFTFIYNHLKIVIIISLRRKIIWVRIVHVTLVLRCLRRYHWDILR